MLNRRYLRIKVLQALYAYFSLPANQLKVVEKNMIQSIQRVYDLYLYKISILLDVLHAANLNLEKNKAKRLPTEEDLNPNTRFIDNKVLKILNSNIDLKEQLEKKKINWQVNFDDIKKLWRTIKSSDMYENYMNHPENDFAKDRKFIVQVYEKFIQDEPVFEHLLHEQSIYWYTDMEVVDLSVMKTFSSIAENTGPINNILLPLIKDEVDDMKFIKELLNKTILFEKEYSDIIAQKTNNWELERIAIIDIILMKMGMCELEHFNSIPVKVTLNEYIELAKNFSTPKSKNFINGILDKVVQEWKSKNRIEKIGRGLKE